MPTVPRGSKVLVSGANGYIAMWVVQSLLERGYIVRGTVRSADKGKFTTDYFTKLGYGDKLEIVVVEDIVKVQYSMILFHHPMSNVGYFADRRVHLTKL